MKKLIKLDFTLEQIVSMIHFQGDEEGATIRATELKPKFDRFLYRKLASERNLNWNVKPFFDEEKNMIEKVINDMSKNNELSQWLIEEPKKVKRGLKIKNHALNYRVKISVNEIDLIKDNSSKLIKPGIQNNKGRSGREYYGAAQYVLENQRKTFGVHKVGKKFKKIKVEIFCYDENVADAIEEAFPIFIASTGFGYASGKGYGSFSVIQVSRNGQNSRLKGNENTLLPFSLLKDYRKIMNIRDENVLLYSLDYNGENKNAITELDWLDTIAELNHYIKSGLNIPSEDEDDEMYYPSPLMKKYFKTEGHEKTINDKKMMKHVASKQGVALKTNHLEEDTEHYEIPNDGEVKYVRGLFGFAVLYKFLVEEEYGADIIFSVKAETKDKKSINRFANPISYRIVKENNIYKTYLVIDLRMLRIIQESNPTIKFISNYRNVEIFEATLPSSDEFSMKRYIEDIVMKDEDNFFKDINIMLSNC